MAANSSDQADMITPAVALTELFTTYPALTPEASGLAWTLTPAGVLHAEARDATDGGLALLLCADLLGGTPLITGQGRESVGEVVAVWRGVPVEVWESWTTPEPPLPLGAVAVLPAVGGAR